MSLTGRIFSNELFLLLWAVQLACARNISQRSTITGNEEDLDPLMTKLNFENESLNDDSKRFKKNTASIMPENVNEKIISTLQQEYENRESNTLEIEALHSYFTKAKENLDIIDNALSTNTNDNNLISPRKLYFLILRMFTIKKPLGNMYINLNFGTVQNSFKAYYSFSNYIRNSWKWYTFLDELKVKLSTTCIQDSKKFIYDFYEQYLNVCESKHYSLFLGPNSWIRKFVDNLGILDCKAEPYRTPLNFNRVINMTIEKVKIEFYCRLVDEMLNFTIQSMTSSDKLTITGKFIHLDDVMMNERDKKIKNIEIFAEKKVFIYSSLSLDNTDELIIIAPLVEVVPLVICCLGTERMYDVEPYKIPNILDDGTEGSNKTDIFSKKLDNLIFRPEFETVNCKQQTECFIIEKIEIKLRRGIESMEHLGLSGSVLYIISEDIINDRYFKVNVTGGVNGKAGITKVLKLNKKSGDTEVEIINSADKIQSQSYKERLKDILMDPVNYTSIQDALNKYKEYVLAPLIDNDKLTSGVLDFFKQITDHSSLTDYIEIKSMDDEFSILNELFFKYISSHLNRPESLRFNYWIFLYKSLLMRVNEGLKFDDSIELFSLRVQLACVLNFLKYTDIETWTVSIEETSRQITGNLTELKTPVDHHFLKSQMTNVNHIMNNIIDKFKDVIEMNVTGIIYTIIHYLEDIHLETTKIQQDESNTRKLEVDYIYIEDDNFEENKANFMFHLTSAISLMRTNTNEFKKAIISTFKFIHDKDTPVQDRNIIANKLRMITIRNLIMKISQRQLNIIRNMLYELENGGAIGIEIENFISKLTVMKMQWNRFFRFEEPFDDNDFDSLLTDLLTLKPTVSTANKLIINTILSKFKTEYFILQSHMKHINSTEAEDELYSTHFTRINIAFKAIVNDVVRSVQYLVKHPILKYSRNSQNIIYTLNNLLESLLEKSKKFFGCFTEISHFVQEYMDKKLVVIYAEYLYEVKMSTIFKGLLNAKEKDELVTWNFMQDVYQRATENLKMYIFPFAEAYVSDEQFSNVLWTNYSLQEVTDIADFYVNRLDENLLIHKAPDNQRPNKYFLRKISQMSYTWANKSHSNAIGQLLAGEETEFEAKLSKDLNSKSAVKFNKIAIIFKPITALSRGSIINLSKHFKLHVKHSGKHFYKCGKRHYLIKCNSISWLFNLNNPEDPDATYKKIINGDAILSPYTTWTLKLVPKKPLYSNVLKQFQGHVDLDLQISGTYIKINAPVCNRRLQEFYMLQLN